MARSGGRRRALSDAASEVECCLRRVLGALLRFWPVVIEDSSDSAFVPVRVPARVPLFSSARAKNGEYLRAVRCCTTSSYLFWSASTWSQRTLPVWCTINTTLFTRRQVEASKNSLTGQHGWSAPSQTLTAMKSVCFLSNSFKSWPQIPRPRFLVKETAIYDVISLE